MVRQLNRRILLDWRAVLIIFIGSGAIVWHILACRESPMSFSPQGDRLAFVTMEPFGTSDLLLRGTHAYRLMVATKAREVRVVETSTTDMLCAPAFSPDGASLAYLQIPLPTPERLQTLRELESERSAQTQPSAPTWLDQSAVQGTPAPDEALDVVDETLPPISGAMWFLHLQKSLPPVPARLIIRDARTDAVQARIPVQFWMNLDGSSELLNYLLVRPQYSPDGASIYLAAGGVVMAVDVQSHRLRVLAASKASLNSDGPLAPVARLSPDGKYLALLMGDAEPVLAIARTDGSSIAYHRWLKKTSMDGLAWTDKQTIAMLEPKSEAEQWLHFVDTSGTIRRSVQLHMAIAGDQDAARAAELAVSPNGRYLVVAFEKDVYFLRSSGAIVHHWHAEVEGTALVQPTFSPDGKTVAFKLIEDTNSDSGGTRAIVYYTPKGEKMAEVTLPALPAGTTQPVP